MAAPDMDEGLICIDSEDEAGANDVVPPSDRLICLLMLPQGDHWAEVDEVVITLQYSESSGANSEQELEFSRLAASASGELTCPKRFRVPASFVGHMEEFLDSQGRLVVFALSPPMSASDFLSHDSNTVTASTVGSRSEGLVEEIALRPRYNETQSAIATFRWWLPHAKMLSSSLGTGIGCSDASDEVALRLEGISLTARDIDLLEDEQCLNDSVLDFFLRLVLDIVAPAELRSDVYLASTFFFQKLTSGGVTNGEQGWHNVCRWTRSLPGGLLGHRYLVLPINEHNIHWWLVVVCNPRQALEDGRDTAAVGREPRIVCLDSAVEPPPKYRAVGFLRGYLWRECCERQSEQGYEVEDRLTKLKTTAFLLKACIADVPKQANGYDCGIFIIEYLLHLLQSQSALEGLGLAPHMHWFGQCSVSHRRMQLRWVATTLQHEARCRDDPDVGKLLQDADLKAAIIRALTEPFGKPDSRKRPMESRSGSKVVLPLAAKARSKAKH